MAVLVTDRSIGNGFIRCQIKFVPGPTEFQELLIVCPNIMEKAKPDRKDGVCVIER